MSWGRTNITKCVRCRSICCTNTCDKRRSKNIYLLCPCRWLTARPVALTPHRCVSKASVWRQAVTSWLDPTRDWISVECVEGVGSPVERSLAPITKQRKCSKSFPYKWKWYTHTHTERERTGLNVVPTQYRVHFTQKWGVEDIQQRDFDPITPQ